MNFCLKVVKKRDYARMDYSLALMQGKNSRFYRDFGKAAGKWITNKDQAIRSLLL